MKKIVIMWRTIAVCLDEFSTNTRKHGICAPSFWINNSISDESFRPGIVKIIIHTVMLFELENVIYVTFQYTFTYTGLSYCMHYVYWRNYEMKIYIVLNIAIIVNLFWMLCIYIQHLYIVCTLKMFLPNENQRKTIYSITEIV